MYPLRVLVSSDEERAKTSLNFWKGALLMKTALTEPAEMLAAKDMVVMEDMAEGALPATTTAHQNQSMTERHIQIGLDAASKLLASLLSGTTADNVAAFAVVDLSPRTGDFGLAVLHAIQDSLVPVHYIACPEDDEHADWLDWWMKHKTAELILTGSLKPTGVLLPPEEPPAEELTCLPPKPTLSALVWADRQGESAAVRLPEGVVAKWSSSAEFTEPVNKLLTSIADVSSDPVVAPPVRQRPRIAEQTRSPAARVVDAIPVSQLPPLVHDIKLLSARVKDLALCVAAPAAPDSGALFIANRSEADVSIPAGTLVAGFFTGRWMQIAQDGDALDPTRDVAFTLDSAYSPVLVGGIVATPWSGRRPARSSTTTWSLIPSPARRATSLKNEVVYRCADLPAVKKEPEADGGDPALGLSQAHAASALPPQQLGHESHADRLDRAVPPGEGPGAGAPAGPLEGLPLREGPDGGGVVILTRRGR